MRLLCVVPSRIGSTRLAEKPLQPILGQSLIRHVTRRVQEFQLGPVVVATDDARVAHQATACGATAVLTRGRYRSGTERVAAVAARPEFAGFELILNVQGDEPLIEREAVVGAVERVRAGDQIGTAAGRLEPGDWWNRDRVKVQTDQEGRAWRFFRTPAGTAYQEGEAVFQHVGVYAFRREALLQWMELPPTPGEEALGLEQLRPLEHGMTIGVAVLPWPVAHGVDTEGDLEEIGRLMEVKT